MSAHLDANTHARNFGWHAGLSEVSSGTLQQRYAHAATRMIDVGRLTLRVRDEGQGPVIVLLHGTGASLETWDGWARCLVPAFRVIRPDLPGFGVTGPDPRDDYALEQYIETLHALLRVLGVERAVLGGNSLGGQIAAHFSAVHPALVRGLVLVAPAGFHRQAPGPFVPLRSGVGRALFRFAAPRMATHAGLALAYGNPRALRAEIVDRYQDMLLRPGNRDALARNIAMVPDHGLTEQTLSRIVAPTLLLWGKRDRLTRWSEARRFTQHIATTELCTYDELGHVPHEEAPERTAHDVLRFLRALP